MLLKIGGFLLPKRIMPLQFTQIKYMLEYSQIRLNINSHVIKVDN